MGKTLHPPVAHAFLAVAAALERDTHPTPVGLITLVVNEFRRLFDMVLLTTRRTIASLLAWSRWRRRHQYRASYPATSDKKTNDHELPLQY